MMKREILKRSMIYLFASLVNSGLQNVIPQVFFSEHYPQHQEILLSICLLAGAVFSLGTIFVTQKGKQGSVAKITRLTLVEMVFISLLLISLWIWKTALPYILSFLMLRALLQVVYNRIDHRYVQITHQNDIGFHTRVITLLQLFGVMVGPLYFSLIYTHLKINLIIILSLVLVIVWSIYKPLKKQPSFLLSEYKTNKESFQPLSTSDIKYERSKAIFFMIFLLAATTGIRIFSNNVILIVRDGYGLKSPVVKGGIILMIMNAAGILTVATLPIFRSALGKYMPTFSKTFRKYDRYSIYASLFILCVILLKWPVVLTFTYLIGLSILTGAVYGVFWLKTREYAIDRLVQQRKKWLLTLYNNANNFSMLFSASTLFLSAIISSRWQGSYLNIIMTVLIGFFSISGYFAFLLDYKNRKNKITLDRKTTI